MKDLPLPDPGTLSAEQQRGAACVWCGAPLNNAAACDLGPRLFGASSAEHWFPRCCSTCRRERV
ncbi:hypothetical protein [Streptomyces sp. NPDC057509]|uniref:hypothetical protein n=1 Tax=Streptomyces sp. NPDC057509 TaxID=3346152 RepID=UPI00367753BD